MTDITSMLPGVPVNVTQLDDPERESLLGRVLAGLRRSAHYDLWDDYERASAQALYDQWDQWDADDLVTDKLRYRTTLNPGWHDAWLSDILAEADDGIYDTVEEFTAATGHPSNGKDSVRIRRRRTRQDKNCRQELAALRKARAGRLARRRRAARKYPRRSRPVTNRYYTTRGRAFDTRRPTAPRPRAIPEAQKARICRDRAERAMEARAIGAIKRRKTVRRQK